MTNIFRTITDSQSRRWEKVRSAGRAQYVLKRSLLGALIPSILIWALFRWTSLGNFIFLFIALSIPIDYALARMSWVYQEYRYNNSKNLIPVNNQKQAQPGAL